MAHSHYVMDSYFPEREGSTKLRREVMRIVADDDEAARIEAKRLDAWKQSSFFEVRAISSSARSGDKLVLSTRVQDPTTSEAT